MVQKLSPELYAAQSSSVMQGKVSGSVLVHFRSPQAALPPHGFAPAWQIVPEQVSVPLQCNSVVALRFLQSSSLPQGAWQTLRLSLHT
jgi:hypothetical protein